MIEYVVVKDCNENKVWWVGDNYRSKEIHQIYEIGDGSVVFYDEHTNALVKYPMSMIERIVYYEVNE